MKRIAALFRLRQPDEIDDPLTSILRSGARQLLAQAVEMEAEALANLMLLSNLSAARHLQSWARSRAR
jgi:putative transposase